MTEFELIALITKGAPRAGRGIICGVGDDCAVLQDSRGKDLLVTTDALFEGVHFRREWMGFEAIGAKAMAVNLSDIAAMGGRPKYWLAAVGLPKRDVHTAKAIYNGLVRRAKKAGVVMIGGDTNLSRGGIVIAVTVIGEVRRGRAVLRSGAKAGDEIYVTGAFGASRMGLEFLGRGRQGAFAAKFIKRHRFPPDRLKLGENLGQTRLVTSMIDVSDGLLADLGRIANESGVGYEICADLVPLEKGLQGAARSIGLDPLQLALAGGEDYELLFTVDGRKAGKFNVKKFGATKIGTVVSGRKERRVVDAKGRNVVISAKGYDHFC